MLTKCVNCEFYVRPDDEFCLNCGIEKPAQSLSRSRFSIINFLILDLIFTLAILTIIALSGADFSNRLVFFQSLFTAAFLGSTISVFLEGSFLAARRSRKENAKRTAGQVATLRGKNRLIELRIGELRLRGANIDAVLDKIRDTDGENLQAVRQKLRSAREIVMSQFARYELQKHKIELVRLQNNVSPYLFRAHRLNEFETENGLVTLENIHAEISRIRQKLTSHAALDFPTKTRPEKEHFLAQLAETDDSCQKLREALLSSQAARALQAVSPIEENLNFAGAKEIGRESEVFNIQTTLTDFSESFEALEHEYKRLKIEEETERKLLES